VILAEATKNNQKNVSTNSIIHTKYKWNYQFY